MSQLFNRFKVNGLLKVPVRYPHGPNHWSVLKKQKLPKDRALQHFDEFYKSVYGNAWPNIREALIRRQHKYMALINNFSDTEKIVAKFELSGAMNLRLIYNAQKKIIAERKKYYDAEYQMENVDEKSIKSYGETLDDKIDTILAKQQLSEVQSVYPPGCDVPINALNSTSEDDTVPDRIESFKTVPLQSLDSDIEQAEYDINRIVKPSIGLSASTLYEFIPATKIKGKEDWVLESEQYEYFKKGSDFSVEVEKESTLNFPEHLLVYTYEENNDTRFLSPRKGTSDVLDYYLLNGGSILPVLALDLQPGDKVLDMCAAPGGKSLAIIQTLLPQLIVANDLQESRTNRIRQMIMYYLSNMGLWDGRLFVTQNDAKKIDDRDIYNKILVDVPCTTDRHSLHTTENNIFKPSRLKERLKLPEEQVNILTNALKLVQQGGTVVYATCTLSPIENDGVVQMALKNAWEETNSVMVVKDMTEALKPLRCLFKFGTFGLKYGHIVIPNLKNNFGPMYFCKIERIQ